MYLPFLHWMDVFKEDMKDCDCLWLKHTPQTKRCLTQAFKCDFILFNEDLFGLHEHVCSHLCMILGDCGTEQLAVVACQHSAACPSLMESNICTRRCSSGMVCVCELQTVCAHPLAAICSTSQQAAALTTPSIWLLRSAIPVTRWCCPQSK